MAVRTNSTSREPPIALCTPEQAVGRRRNQAGRLRQPRVRRWPFRRRILGLAAFRPCVCSSERFVDTTAQRSQEGDEGALVIRTEIERANLPAQGLVLRPAAVVVVHNFIERADAA